jgi:mono/diheme cytochrome c family protein
MPDSVRATGYLPAWLYLAGVAVVTMLGIGLAMALRPAFANSVLEFLHLQAAPLAAKDSFYAVRVAPLFETHCVSCHGERRQKAALRLDNYAAALRGGRHGAVIRPGDVKNSELMERITLPSADDRAMPPEGKTPLSPDDIKVIRLWIAAGASPSLKVAAIKGAPRLVRDVTIPDFDPAQAARQRMSLAAEVERLSRRYPGLLNYQSRNSADLELDASSRGAAFGDADLQAFAPLTSRLVRVDLSGTAITDASAPVLAGMPALKGLRLANTKTGDKMLAALVSLKALKSVTVDGTHAQQSSLAPLRSRGVAIYGDGDAK